MFNLCEIVQQGKLNWKSPTRKIKLKLSNRKNELKYLVYKRNWTDFVQQEKWTDIVDKKVLSQFKSHNSKWDSFAIKAKFEIQFMMKKSQINVQFVTEALHNWTNWKDMLILPESIHIDTIHDERKPDECSICVK